MATISAGKFEAVAIQAVTIACSARPTPVNLGVNVSNSAAIARYQAAGFTSFGSERAFKQLDGEFHDELCMVCVL